MTEPRWRVTISNVTGDRSLLESTLAAAGFDLDGDMLSGEKFEKHDTPDAVRDVADDIARKIRELARLIPDFDMGFDAGPVHEYDDDGTEHIHHIVRISGATTLGLAGTVATLSDWIEDARRASRDQTPRSRRPCRDTDPGSDRRQ